jgi:hypothetical protein
MLFHLKCECSSDKYRIIITADTDGDVRIFLETILAVDSIISHIILNGYRRIMYKISLTIIMASAIAAILIVPWATLQRSHAQSDLADTILKIHNDERAAHSMERQPSRRGPDMGRASRDDRQVRA